MNESTGNLSLFSLMICLAASQAFFFWQCATYVS